MKHRLILVAMILAVSPVSVWCQKISKENLVSEGKKRTYYLYVPNSVKPDSSFPLLILLHGSNHIGLSLAEKWKDQANQEGFIFVAPNSLDSAYWGTPADGPVFLRDLVDAIKEKYPINLQQVYLFGHSGGAGFALLMALYESEYFAAVAVHAGALPSSGLDLISIARRKTPIHIQVGTDDHFFPIPVVRMTRDALKAASFPVELKEIPNHTHWYYDRAREINSTAWNFLKANQLSSAPVFETHNFKKSGEDSKKQSEGVSHYNRGLQRLQARDWAGAIAAFTRVIELDGKDADAFNNRGVAYTNQKNYDAALADLTRSLQLKPTDGAYSNRAGIYFAQKKIDEAIADFSEALKLKPTAEIHADRGLGYAQQGKVDLALADYEQAIKLNPKFARSYLLRGLLALNRGDAESAQKDFDKGFALDSQLHAEFDDIIQQIKNVRGVK